MLQQAQGTSPQLLYLQARFCVRGVFLVVHDMLGNAFTLAELVESLSWSLCAAKLGQ